MPSVQLPSFQLSPPSTEFKTSYLACLREWQEEGLPWHLGKDLRALDAEFDRFISRESSPDHRHPNHDVLETVLWAVTTEMGRAEIAGRIAIRHDLTDALKTLGGHIGYDTRPSMRGRGVAQAMLRDSLPIARSLGLRRVLLTCDATNAASIRVIERNGGVLAETRELMPGHSLKRYYWIDTGGSRP